MYHFEDTKFMETGQNFAQCLETQVNEVKPNKKLRNNVAFSRRCFASIKIDVEENDHIHHQRQLRQSETAYHMPEGISVEERNERT